MGAAGCPGILGEPGAGTRAAAARGGEPRPRSCLLGWRGRGLRQRRRKAPLCMFPVFLALPVGLARVWVGLHVFTFLSCSVLGAYPTMWPFMNRDCSELRFFVPQF